MAAPKPADVDAYLATQPDDVRAALVQARAALRRALPGAVETIKYGMPAYAVEGRAVASFAGWKASYAVYIVPTDLFAAIARDLVGREATKGIIRLALDEPVPEAVVQRLAAWNPAAGTTNKASANNTPANKATANKATANNTPANKAPANKAPANKATANKTPANNTPANNTPANKARSKGVTSS